jgi:curved DNA-binding protein CbpA
MTEKFNLYDALHADPGDITDTIKNLYRKLAKRMHPDVGGDPEAFRRIQFAYGVLSDPERRKRYDETGEIDHQSIDNRRAAALQRISMEIGKHFDAFIMRGFSPQFDPSGWDMIGLVREQLGQELATVKEQVEIGTKAIAFYGKMQKKFKKHGGGPNALADMMAAKIKQSNESLAMLAKAIEELTYALEVCNEFYFDRDSTSYAGSTTTASTKYILTGLAVWVAIGAAFIYGVVI